VSLGRALVALQLLIAFSHEISGRILCELWREHQGIVHLPAVQYDQNPIENDQGCTPLLNILSQIRICAEDYTIIFSQIRICVETNQTKHQC
jgi:hypothetical protein